MAKFFLDAEQVDKLAEDAVAKFGEPTDVSRGFAINPLVTAGAAERGDFSLVVGDAQPAMDHRSVYFEMKLKPIHIALIAKCLVRA